MVFRELKMCVISLNGYFFYGILGDCDSFPLCYLKVKLHCNITENILRLSVFTKLNLKKFYEGNVT
jgi:hypothetical protein